MTSKPISPVYPVLVANILLPKTPCCFFFDSKALTIGAGHFERTSDDLGPCIATIERSSLSIISTS